MSEPALARALPPTLFELGGHGPHGSAVFFPDYGGNVLYARPLVPLLGPSLRCFGLRLTADLLETPGGLGIEALGRRYAADLEAAGLAAPLHLIGFSFGGIVAFETARHLARTGPAPARLWIADTQIHRLFPQRYLPRSLRHELRHAVRWLRDNRRRLLRPSSEPDVLHRYRQIRLDLSEHPQAYRGVIRTLYEALARYRPRPWDGDATVLRARDQTWAHVGDDLGWDRLIRGVLRTAALQTTHLGLLQSPEVVRQVARIILAPTDESTRSDPA